MSPTITDRRDIAPALWLFATAISLLACNGGGGGPAGPDPGNGPEPRTYAMGFGPTPPRATIESIVETAQSLAQRSELVLIQQEVPWASLLDGTQTMDEAVEERVRLEEFVRGLGLEILFLLDPLDGLDRRREPPELVARARSIVEPEIRANHDEWALEMARVFRPEWYGLASEVNTLADLGDPALHAAVRDMINDLSPQVKAASPGTRTFVSFQADQAYGLPGFPRTIDHFALIDDYAVDALGLSTYPVFVLDDPSELPADFFARFDQATDRPLLLVEGGWSSEVAGGTNGTPAEQAEFFRRMAALLDGIRAEAWVFLLYADLDLESYGLPPDREAGFANFSRMGIVDVELRPKPAAAVWDSVFARPLVN